jgi:hypothetical protein
LRDREWLRECVEREREWREKRERQTREVLEGERGQIEGVFVMTIFDSPLPFGDSVLKSPL